MNKQTLTATTLAVGATAAAGSVASKPRITRWYSRLRKPQYVPPDKVFPVAWTTLYGDIAVTSATAIDRFESLVFMMVKAFIRSGSCPTALVHGPFRPAATARN